MENHIAELYTILESSSFLKSIGSVNKSRTKSRIFGNRVRLLTAQEIKKLKAQGNRAGDWKNILVCSKFKTENISDNYFAGKCVLGFFSGREIKAEESAALPSGIYKSTIIDSEIGDGCCIWEAKCVSNYIVKAGSVVFYTGSLVCGGKSAFGNGRDIPIGIETGGRGVLSFAEMTIPIAQSVCTQRSNASLLGEYKDFVSRYTEACSAGFGIIESNCVIRNTAKIEDCYIGAAAVIDGATLVQNCTILSSSEEPVEISHGAYVKNSCIQWGCCVTSMAIVDDSILTEHSHAERHAKVTQSIIGPNTGVAEGEVTASLVGPFVGFHHQAMLIAAIWPEGKGNVAYGANIGSNHTSKAPDQEIWCGEGTFFGLGVNIKFPADFTNAPYSIIATGVTTLPQRVEFPFSLINTPSQRFDCEQPAYNEILPTWALYENAYAVKRNEAKFKRRNKAKRTAFVSDVLRPEIVDMMAEAKKRLNEISDIKDFYTEKDIPGLGKNFMAEESRVKAIGAYGKYIEYYSLRGLKERIDELIKANGKEINAAIYDAETDSPVWEHQRRTLLDNGFAGRTVKDNLLRLAALEAEIAFDVQKAKEKDDVRGIKIIADYKDAHTDAIHDPFVKETWEAAEKMRDEIRALIKKF
ncbi:MAG: DUF4954 family protein [Spirochaetota bacterium]